MIIIKEGKKEEEEKKINPLKSKNLNIWREEKFLARFSIFSKVFVNWLIFFPCQHGCQHGCQPKNRV